MNKLVLVLLLVGCVALLTLLPQVEASFRKSPCYCQQICGDTETDTGSCPDNKPGKFCCYQR
ncbi:hypothetical protein DPMN_013192 [Dreissena polymorpha]|uniref:Uncharacterized protein n=1 Tax=Dreissena polymorpha TaxID=45954 RepID=A0A9D4S430_DREPO|nr:hypothetical protein DPMN_013192 [Dreissena polymorpha]